MESWAHDHYRVLSRTVPEHPREIGEIHRPASPRFAKAEAATN
jgi:hypothetical protein